MDGTLRGLGAGAGNAATELLAAVLDKTGVNPGLYSTFLLHAKRLGEKYGVDPLDILVELGRRKTMAGQEDMILDVALDLSRKAAVKQDAP